MTTITLPPRCDLAAADAVLPDLLAAQGANRLAIDGSQVEQIGQAMLQLLVSARRTGGGATITPSPVLVQAGRMAGLTDELFEEAQP